MIIMDCFLHGKWKPKNKGDIDCPECLAAAEDAGREMFGDEAEDLPDDIGDK